MLSRIQLTDRSTSLLRSGILPWVLVALLGLSLVTLLLAGGKTPSVPENQVDPRAVVRVATVQAADASSRLRLSGVTRAVERGDLAFLHAGHLAERPVRRGQQVVAGDVLAILHNPSLMPGVAAAEARARELEQQLDQLEREAQRLDDLHQRNLVPTEELERVESRRNVAREALTQARVGLDEAREQLDEAFLRAPFDATVIDLYIEPGQFVAAGQPVLGLSGSGGLEIELYVTAGHLDGLVPGQSVTVHEIERGRSGTGTIAEIGPAGPGRPARVIVTLATRDAIDSPGQPVHVELTLADDPGLKVPLAAIVSPGTGSGHLFRIVDERIIRVPVELGRLDGDWVIVDGPLAAGDQVVVAGQGQLLEDEIVRVLP